MIDNDDDTVHDDAEWYVCDDGGDCNGDNTMGMRRENPRKEEAREITARPVLRERN